MTAACAITCGACGRTTDAAEWCRTPLAGDLPARVIQCPACGVAVDRRAVGVRRVGTRNLPERIEIRRVQPWL